MHYGKVGFKSALLILTVLCILMVCLTVHMLTVAYETRLFTKSHQLPQNQKMIILVTNQPTRLQVHHSCSKSTQANRDQDLSSGRMYSVTNNLAVPVSLELRYQQGCFVWFLLFGKRSTSEWECRANCHSSLTLRSGASR